MMQVASPNPPGTNNSLTGVSAASASNIWAAGTAASGSASSTLISHWDGTLWTQVVSPNPGTRNVLNSVVAVSATEAWAAGSTDNTTLLLHFQAGTWTVAPSPNPGTQNNQLHAVAGIATNDIWAVGEYSNVGSTHLLLLHWDGSAWSQIAGPTVSGNSILYGVSAQTSSNAWAVGTSWVGSTYSTVLLHWNGSAWSQVPSPMPGDLGTLYGVTMLSSADGWAVGGFGVQTLSLHWDGSTWSQVASPNPGSNGNLLYNVSGTGGSDIWTVGEMDTASGIQTLVLHWDGSSWSQVASPNPGSGGDILYGVAAVSMSDIWAVGLLASGSNDNTLILHSCALPTATPTATPTEGVSPTSTSSPLASTPTSPATLTPTATPTIGSCAQVVWTNLIHTTVINGALIKTDGVDGLWDAGATSTLGILAAPACFRIDSGATLGSERVFGLTHNEHSSGYDDIDYGIYLGVTGELRVVQSGNLLPGNYGTYAPGDSFQIAVEGPQGTTVNFYRNAGIFYTSTVPAILPLLGDASIATRNGAIPPAHLCGDGIHPLPTVSPYPSYTPYPTYTPYPSATPAAPTVTETPCGITFTDVHAGDYFATPVSFLACHAVISGYADGTYRPYNTTTRAQQVKIVVLGFSVPGYTPLPGSYLFADVPRTNPFFAYIETAAHASIVGGYNCGGPGEPCDALHRPYFRPYAYVTRGQLSKIVVVAASWRQVTPTNNAFADVLPGTAFYTFVETAVCHGIISGYACGGPGEPCNPQQQPYFRQYNNATRGQIAKIVYGALTSTATCPLGTQR